MKSPMQVFTQDLWSRDCAQAPLAPGRVPWRGCFGSIERPRRAARAAFFFRPPAHLNEFDRRGPKKKRPQLGARSLD